MLAFSVNVSLILDMAADGFGERTVLGPRSDGLTAARLRSLARAGAETIAEEDADCLVYLGPNGLAFEIAMFSAAEAVVPFVPLNYRLGTSQLARLLSRHRGGITLLGSAIDTEAMEPGVRFISRDAWTAAVEARALQQQGNTSGNASSDAVAALIYSSGTTGDPKAVVLRHRHLASYVFSSIEFGAAGPTEAALMCVPPYHIAAVANALTNLYAGRRLVVMDAFNEQAWLDAVRREAITHAFLVPTMLARIVDLARGGADVSVPSLQTLSYGGAQMPHRVIEGALALWPDVSFVNAYGLTETASTISVLGPTDHRVAAAGTDQQTRARLSSAGRPLPTVEVEIRDEAGRPTARGTRGRIWVRGPQVAGEYLEGGPAASTDGFFDTRDEGHFDCEGYLFVEGRVDDTIIRGGENIAPSEIERVLLQHHAVREAIVVGVPDEEWGETLAAVVVPQPAAVVDPDDVRLFVRSVLRRSKTPDRIDVWPALPYTELGKVSRREVLARLLAC